MKRDLTIWKFAYWILLIASITGAGLFMARVRGGFLTNYLSDLAFPPWTYIFIRGLWNDENKIPRLLLVGNWFGLSPERTAVSIMLAGIISEVKTLYWPNGFISGRFDPWDILAYAIGLIVCYYFDKRTQPVK